MNRLNAMIAVALVSAGLSACSAMQDRGSQQGTSMSSPSSSSMSTQQTAAVGEVRNWEAIDKNKDGLISPEEMEAELQRKGG